MRGRLLAAALGVLGLAALLARGTGRGAAWAPSPAPPPPRVTSRPASLPQPPPRAAGALPQPLSSTPTSGAPAVPEAPRGDADATAAARRTAGPGGRSRRGAGGRAHPPRRPSRGRARGAGGDDGGRQGRAGRAATRCSTWTTRRACASAPRTARRCCYPRPPSEAGSRLTADASAPMHQPRVSPPSQSWKTPERRLGQRRVRAGLDLHAGHDRRPNTTARNPSSTSRPEATPTATPETTAATSARTCTVHLLPVNEQDACPGPNASKPFSASPLWVAPARAWRVPRSSAVYESTLRATAPTWFDGPASAVVLSPPLGNRAMGRRP